MALDERTLRYLAAVRHMNPDVAERYFSRPGAGGFVNPDRPTLARALQDLGGIGGTNGPRTLSPGGSVEQTINVDAAPPRAPAGAAVPSTPDESALASQAGWGGAADALAPYLGDWRATPAQILAAAVGGYNKSRYAAQQDIAAERRAEATFGLQKRQLEAELAADQEKREAAAKQRAALEAGIANLPPEVQEKAKLLLAAGETDALAEMISPKRQNLMTVGRTVFDPNTNQPVYTAPQDGPTAFQRMQYGLDLAKFEWDKAHPSLGAPVAVQGPNGPILVPPSQSYGMQPADTRELAGTEGEREDRRMLDIAGRVGAAGSWNDVSPEDRAWYGLKYRERAAPKFGLDPNTGLVIQTNPDMSSLPLPSEMQPHQEQAAAPEPAAPVQLTADSPEANRPMPGGQTLMNKEGAREPVPTVDNGPPSPAAQPPKLAYGPAAGRVPITQGPTKQQTEKFNDALAARNDMVAATGRLRELLRENSGQTALVGDSATKFRIAAQQIVTALGGLGNAGVLQPSDIDRFTAMFGDPTSLTGYLGNMTGIKPLTSALDELDTVVAKKVQNRASEAGVPVFSTDEEADAGIDALPNGAKFVGPDGQTYVKGQ